MPTWLDVLICLVYIAGFSFTLRFTLERTLRAFKQKEVDCFEERRGVAIRKYAAIDGAKPHDPRWVNHINPCEHRGDYSHHPSNSPAWPIGAAFFWPLFLIGWLWMKVVLFRFNPNPATYVAMKNEFKLVETLEQAQQILATSQKIITDAAALPLVDEPTATAELILNEGEELTRRLEAIEARAIRACLGPGFVYTMGGDVAVLETGRESDVQGHPR